METKACCNCKIEKELNNFAKDKDKKDGHRWTCKECQKEKYRKWYIKNQQKVLLKVRLYQQTEKGREYSRRRSKKYRQENKDKRKVHAILQRAVKNGKMVRKPCSNCGSTYYVHGHHEDYNKPLDVIWLCAMCHCQKHRPGANPL